MNRKILLVPLGREGKGTGHVRRCLAVAARLGPEATICLDGPGELAAWRTDPLWPADLRAVDSPEIGAPYDLVVLDRRETSASQLTRYAAAGPVVCLDEGGEARALACYLVDLIPGSAAARGAARRPPNREAPELMELPAPVRSAPPGRIRSVLVSFGGEDPAHLTEAFLRAYRRLRRGGDLEVTVVRGSRFGRAVELPGVRVVDSPTSLTALYAAADLVVTAYGLTAFESLAAGTPVALANHSAYHARLVRRAGLPSLGRRAPRSWRLRRILGRPEALWPPVVAFQERVRRSAGPAGVAGLAGLLDTLAGALRGFGSAGCPLCSRPGAPVFHPAVARAADRTTFRCTRSGLLYAVPFPEHAQRYGSSYFFEEYRAQYGKTYLEDFDTIAEASRGRMAVVRELAAAPGPLLDVGCAYGPFLVACREAGFRPLGLDISAEAVAHVQRELGIPAMCADFAEADLDSLRSLGARCVTMWYVIEHFRALAEVLRRVNALLPVGGLFAFSTPSSGGVSGRSDLRRFLERSPQDHFTIWSPACVRSVLEPFGFRVARIRVTGHHPERSRLLGAAPRLGRSVSRLLGLGDTFEVYALKVRHGGGRLV